MKRRFRTTAGLSAFLTEQRGKVVHVSVLHDDVCSPGRCVCEPYYDVTYGTIEELTQAFVEGSKAQKAWRKATTN